MIEQELLLLGLLRESPKHGYEIKTKIKESFPLFAGIDLKSIYYPLKILEKKGLIIQRTSKPGKHPERMVYSLTPKGKLRFEELLTKSLLSLKRPQFNLDLSLYFLHYLLPNVARRRLKARMSVLSKLAQSISQFINVSKGKKPWSLTRILEHNLQMVETESRFLDGLIKDL